MLRLRSLGLAALAAAAFGATSVQAADLAYGYRGPAPRAYRYVEQNPGYHFPDRPYGLAAIPLSVGPSGRPPARIVGYTVSTCTPYNYRYYGGCSPSGYGVY